MTVSVPAPQPTEYPTESYTEAVDCGCSDPTCPRLVRHVFVWHALPLNMNKFRTMHFRAWSKEMAEWRDAHELMAKGCEPLAWCNVTVDHLLGTHRNVDVAACLPTFKAALDGIVNAGVLKDDDAAIVRSVRFRAPVFDGRDALIVTLEGPAG